MTAIAISQLSRPKGVRYECEICGKPATLECSDCPTYYCTHEHFDIDWRGIRHLIAADVVVLRERPKLIGSEEERERRNEELRAIRKELLELCTEQSQKFLVQGKYELAVPGALQSLKFAIEIYGGEAKELVPSYLLLAEANLGLRRLKIAEEFLSLANWNILKHPQAGSSMMSSLQRNFGRLYAAQQRYTEALQAFATDIYYSSREFGPENVRSAPSYFHMGRVFQSHKKADRTAAFYQKVVEIYASFLQSWLQADQGVGEATMEISAVEVEEAIEIIKHITEYREKRSGEDAGGAGKVGAAEGRYTLGLLFIYTSELGVAKDCVVSAVDTFAATLGDTHARTDQCRTTLQVIERKMAAES
eukprot:CAMPEP_0204354914 /NCGR_PEP_ID=MMETSP0469-20131031/33748_1 /ASSEMBLY_ACC=CAM_ASM_000384 /TAXON_ID=2969 /ORGANISM="Oxyrrhis marina" /LENGTH=361 /DNA_ID=CAMNT_0051342079 /DNA_START=41 /DNA_END=1126 /DNA_ORIENTATION=-